MKLWWQTKAWPWLRKNWQWILLPVGILMLVGKVFGGRKTTVVASELTGAAEAEREANEKASTKMLEAQSERSEQIVEAKVEHSKEVQVLTEEQRSRAQELAGDPTALNDYLKSVGKEVRK